MACEITITHFVNPHLFYFCEINTEKYAKTKLEVACNENILRANVTPICENSMLAVGYSIAVFFLPWKKLIRARVDFISILSGKYVYTVWALDYGFPFKTKVKYVYNMPQELGGFASHINRGGLANILPTKKVFVNGKEELKYAENFDEDCCNLMEWELYMSFSISFSPILQRDHHHWGDIIVKNKTNEKISLADKLIEQLFAKKSYRFFSHSLVINTRIFPWLDNKGQDIVNSNEIYYAKDCLNVKSHNSVESLSEESKKKSRASFINALIT